MTRRRLRGPLALGLAMLLLAVPAAGCGEDIGTDGTWKYDCPSSRSAPLAIVLGTRRNSPEPRLPEGIEELVVGAAEAGHRIVVLPVDGEPTLELNAKFKSTGRNEVARKDDLVEFVENMRAAMAEVHADTPEADPLTALSLAARAVGQGGTVLLLDSGLQTTRPLDFRQEGMPAADPKEIADYLEANNVLPDLTGRSVVFGALGDVAEPQQPLGGYRTNLVEIWTTIARRGGAGCVEVIDEPNTNDAPSGELPPVSEVAVPQPEELELTDATSCTEQVLREDAQVRFVPDEARFRDPQAVQDRLGRLATQIKEEGLRAELLGTTSSWGTKEGRLRVSRLRAAAVRDVLVDLGVPADRLTAQGLGADSRYHVDDRGPNGELMPGPAARNRSVVIRVGC